jgi:hypothetical protein
MQTAKASILETYNKQELRDIANHGCITGAATEHIYYSETEAFFNAHTDEIEDHLADMLGEDWLQQIAADPSTVAGIQTLINQIVWAYIESIAQSATEAA